MKRLLIPSITVVLTTLVFVSYRAFEDNGEKLLNSLALSVMATLVELDTEPGQAAEVQRAPAGVPDAHRPASSPVPKARAAMATVVVPLPPLKPLPRPLCTVASRAQFASFRPDAVRFQGESFLPPEIQTEIRVVMPEAVHTGDWANFASSCRERSLKACIEKSRNLQRIVILAPGTPDLVSYPITIEQPAI